MNNMMVGSLPELGLQAGFLSPEQYNAFHPSENIPIITRGLGSLSDEDAKKLGPITRTFDVTGDMSVVLRNLGMSMQMLQRAITSTTSGFPVRENLEAEAKILVPLDTPVRNMIPRKSGFGLTSQWRQLTSLGGGYEAATVSTAAAVTTGTAVSITVASSSGFLVGQYVYIDTGANQEFLPITAIADGTHISLVITLNHASGSAIVDGNVEQGSQQGLIQAFYSETGAPATHTSTYANQIAAYKLLGVFGGVTGFAMAAGATFQRQLDVEKRNALLNLYLNEENALINGNASTSAAPWGDGANNLAFNGLVNLITTSNGTPADQVQTSIGSLTTAHIDKQLARLYNRGSMDRWMLMNPQECQSLAHLAEATGSLIRVQATTDGQTVLGVKIQGYVDPTTGEVVPIKPSRFLQPGNIVYGCQRLPDGSPALDVEVLPQVQLPELAPNSDIQGYTAQEIAPPATSPQVYNFIVTVFETLRMKSALHFAIDTGLAAV